VKAPQPLISSPNEKHVKTYYTREQIC